MSTYRVVSLTIIFLLVLVLNNIAMAQEQYYSKNAQKDILNDALLNASLNCDIAKVEDLISDGADPNAVLPNGNTLFIITVINSGHLCEDVVRVMLGKGAKVNTTDSYGNTVLMQAIMKKDTTESLIDLLLSSNADTKRKNLVGQNALMLTVLYRTKLKTFRSQLEKILKSNIDIDDQDNDGKTALMHASEAGSLPAIKLLIKHGADSNIKNTSGYTAKDYALKNNYLDIVKFLDTK